MTNKQGGTTVRLPTQYRSSYKKKKVSIDQTEEIRRCPNCSKTKLLVKHRYKKPDDEKYYKYSKCQNQPLCNYSNYIPLKDE